MDVLTYVYRMNIFVLDEDPELCAQMHCDKHVVKMILESCQLLCTAHHVLHEGTLFNETLLRPTHAQHPCAVWVRESGGNYAWLHELFSELLCEYTHRYRKLHGLQVYQHVLRNPPIVPVMVRCERTPFKQCMPTQYQRISAVDAYRAYYVGEKAHFAKWTRREQPEWWIK